MPQQDDVTLSPDAVDYLSHCGVFECIHFALTHYSSSGSYSDNLQVSGSSSSGGPSVGGHTLHRKQDVYEHMAALVEKFALSWDPDQRTSGLLSQLPSSKSTHPSHRPHISENIPYWNQLVREEHKLKSIASSSAAAAASSSSSEAASSLSPSSPSSSPSSSSHPPLSSSASAPSLPLPSFTRPDYLWSPSLQLRQKRDQRQYLAERDSRRINESLYSGFLEAEPQAKKATKLPLLLEHKPSLKPKRNSSTSSLRASLSASSGAAAATSSTGVQLSGDDELELLAKMREKYPHMFAAPALMPASSSSSSLSASPQLEQKQLEAATFMTGVQHDDTEHKEPEEQATLQEMSKGKSKKEKGEPKAGKASAAKRGNAPAAAPAAKSNKKKEAPTSNKKAK